MIDPGLSGRVALVTGANHGIGAAIARALAAQGVALFLTYYRAASAYSEAELAAARAAGLGGDALYRAGQQQTIDPLLDEIRRQGGQAAGWEADLGAVDNIPLLFDRCEAELGAVDILVNNHTVCIAETFDPALVSPGAGGVHLVSAAGIDAHMTVNARGFALTMSEYARRYLQRGATWGRIVNISTDAAHAHTANISYSASKHAIESYSRSAAAELGQYGITVNIVAPGPIQTGWIPPTDAAEIAAETPLRRVGEPEDVADVVLLLCTQQAHWLTGQLLYVGGGWRMHQ